MGSIIFHTFKDRGCICILFSYLLLLNTIIGLLLSRKYLFGTPRHHRGTHVQLSTGVGDRFFSVGPNRPIQLTRRNTTKVPFVNVTEPPVHRKRIPWKYIPQNNNVSIAEYQILLDYERGCQAQKVCVPGDNILPLCPCISPNLGKFIILLC